MSSLADSDDLLNDKEMSIGVEVIMSRVDSRIFKDSLNEIRSSEASPILNLEISRFRLFRFLSARTRAFKPDAAI